VLGDLITLGSVPVLWLALLAAGLGVPMPEDAVLLAAGVTSHLSSNPWWLVLPIMFSGVLAGDSIVYGLAHRYGEELLSRRPLRWVVTPLRRQRVTLLYQRHGAKAVFAGRHMAGVRVLVFAMAAIEKVPFRTFVIWDALGALITVPFVFSLGFYFSSHVAAVQAGLATAEHWVLAALAFLALLIWVGFHWRRRMGEPHER